MLAMTKPSNDTKLVGVRLYKDERQILEQLAKVWRMSQARVVGKLLRDQKGRSK
jgi:hypothetical protein